ncbi:uncharacterized protein TNCV_2023531, partial [Trichonephila clavipes]
MSSFLGFCEWNTRNRWRNGQVCPDVDKELWRLGPDSSGVFWVLCANRKKEEETREDPNKKKKRRPEREKKEEVTRKERSRKRARKRRGLVVLGSGEENPRVLFRDADQESKTRMRNNALRTGPRQAVKLRKGDLLEVARELGVEVNGDQTKVEIKDMILQNDKNDMETIKAVMEGILEEKEREFEERRQIREFELERMRIQLRNKLNEKKLKAGNRINDLANVCILSGKRTAEVREPVNKGRLLNNPVVNKSVENATSCDFEKKNCDPPTKIAGQSKGGTENTCKADVRKCLKDGLALRLPLSEPREIYKDELATDNRSNIGSEFTFEIDLPGKRDRSTVYRLDLIKLYRRKPELENLVMKNSSEGIDSETLYSVKLFMNVGFQGNLRKSQLYFKLPPDRSSYLRMINAKKKKRFLSGPGTIVLRQKDINLVTEKPFRIKTCCSSQMLVNSLREDTEYFLDLGVNGMGQSNRTLPVVWLGRVNRYPYPRIKCIKYGNLNQVNASRDLFFFRRESLVEKINAASWVTVLDLWKWYFRRSLLMNYPKHTTCVMPVGMYIIKKSRFKFLCAYDECNLTTRILRLLEPIEVPRMVDIDILMEIWKNRVKKIDFVLKWLSRVGSEVGPTKGFCEWNTRNRWRDGQVCPDVDKELWRLGPDSSGVFWVLCANRKKEEETREDPNKKKKRRPEREKKEEVTRKERSRKRARKRRGLVVLGSGEENPRVLFRDADQESKTRMRNNALRTGPRQAVDGDFTHVSEVFIPHEPECVKILPDNKILSTSQISRADLCCMSPNKEGEGQ